MSDADIIKRSLTRRGFLRGAFGVGAALVLPKSLEENIEHVRRFWALDRTMAAVRDIMGDGYLVHSGSSVGGLMIVVTQEELRNIGRGPLTGTIVNQFGVKLEGEVGTLRGPVFVTKFGDAAFREPIEGLVLARN